MSLSARTPTTVKTNLFIPAIYSAQVVEAAKNKLVAWEAVDSSWETDLKKGDILYITKTNTITPTEVVVGQKGTALNPFNTTGVTLTINQWYEAPVDIDTMSRLQSQVELETYASNEAAYGVAKQIDTSVCNLFSSLGGYSTSAYGSDGQTFVDDIAIYIKETLDESDVPDEDRTWVIDPSVLADMLKIDKYLSEQYVRRGAVVSGLIGNSLYGGVVRVTNNLTAVSSGTGSYACLLHKKAIAAAAQIGGKIGSQESTWQEWYKELHQVRIHTEALWGVIELQDAFGIPFFSRKA